MVSCTQAEALCGGMRGSLRVLPSRGSFGYADGPPDREARSGGRITTSTELWCNEWWEWVERLENEVEVLLGTNDNQHDGDDGGDDEEQEEQEDDADGAEFEIAWLVARFENKWNEAKQESKRTSLIAKYGEESICIEDMNAVLVETFSIVF